jgi:hypothetical protein
MSASIIGNSGVVADVDEARNIQVFESIPGYPAAGGFYSVTGQSATTGTPATPLAVAAALAADTMLMSMRMAVGSTRKAYILRFRIMLQPVAANAAAVVPGTIALRRFTGQTPTGGNARTATRFGPSKGSATDITDIRDSNAALTGTAPTWPADGIIASTQVPVLGGAIAAGMYQAGFDWTVDLPAPIELAAGDGLAIRTVTTMPATCTWAYSYNVYWFER